MLYGIKCGIVGKRHIYKMSVAEMRILKWINENTWTYRIWNEEMRLKIEVTLLMKRWVRDAWDGFCKEVINATIRKSNSIQVEGIKKGRVRLKITLVEVGKKWCQLRN